MSPFRTRPEDHAAPAAGEAVREAVGQMVRQFADPMAFYRELVQNGIDAGATGIDVCIVWEPAAQASDDGTLVVAVVDDGAGMDQDIVERSLLVLFRSTKDKDPTKIGKFGVGFFSVFAAGPDEVRVDTGTHPDREGLRLRLRPDFTYELETSDPRRGTAVSLRVAMKRADVAGFVERSVAALSRWCPHVEVPLHVEARDLGGDLTRRRIDAPFSVDGEAAILQRVGASTFAMAACADGSTAWYNRGILLHASSDPVVPNVRLKINSPDLHHTLSRDNVRADEALARAHLLAHKIAAGALCHELLATLRRLAEACAAARHRAEVHPGAGAWVTLLEVSQRPPFSLPPEVIPWPLAAPIAREGETRAVATFDRPGWFRAAPVEFASTLDPLSVAVARGSPVVDLGAAGEARAARVLAVLTSVFGERAADVATRHAMPGVRHDAELDEREIRFKAAVTDVLQAADLGRVELGDALGLGAHRPWITLAARAPAELYAPDLMFHGDEGVGSLARDRVLVLNRRHPQVRAALDASATDLRVAALALARMVLLSAGLLDEASDTALIKRAALGATSDDR